MLNYIYYLFIHLFTHTLTELGWYLIKFLSFIYYDKIKYCWAYSRNASGYIQPDPITFPSGIGALVQYGIRFHEQISIVLQLTLYILVHSLGLKFGIYSSAGTKTCAGRPGISLHSFAFTFTNINRITWIRNTRR